MRRLIAASILVVVAGCYTTKANVEDARRVIEEARAAHPDWVFDREMTDVDGDGTKDVLLATKPDGTRVEVSGTRAQMAEAKLMDTEIELTLEWWQVMLSLPPLGLAFRWWIRRKPLQTLTAQAIEMAAQSGVITNIIQSIQDVRASVPPDKLPQLDAKLKAGQSRTTQAAIREAKEAADMASVSASRAPSDQLVLTADPPKPPSDGA